MWFAITWDFLNTHWCDKYTNINMVSLKNYFKPFILEESIHIQWIYFSEFQTVTNMNISFIYIDYIAIQCILSHGFSSINGELLLELI